MSIFTDISTKSVDTNTFDLSHDRKMSLNFGDLVPILCIETVPGDKFNISTSQMLRFAPMIAPVMHRVNLYTHFFFVPNRILWPNWRAFITGGEDGLDTSVFPYIAFGVGGNATPQEGSLGDYLGLPTGTSYDPTKNVSAMPYAAYQTIYNEYYRDQNLITSNIYVSPLVDGSQGAAVELQPLRKRAWAHDYFTSALPWTQKGVQATIPLGGFAPINLVSGITPTYRLIAGGAPAAGATAISGTGKLIDFNNAATALDPLGSLVADLSLATSSTINDLRRAFKLQEWLEKNARGGSRYIEQILSHFGVRSSDARLQRPEFLGGGSSNVVISEVLQTAPRNVGAAAAENIVTPLGTQGGHGISVGASNSFSHYCEEHGYIIGIMSVMPKSAYSQGIPKHFTKFDKFDYFWPSFGHLGEQPIDNEEIYIDINNSGSNSGVFGYTPRYAEYKHILSSVHGKMRTNLDFWHLGRKFSSLPALNKTFIEMQTGDTSRIFAVTAETSERLYAHVHHSISAKRKMPFFGTPSL